MKLVLKSSGEEFDAPRGIALALLEIGKGAILESKPPAQLIRPTTWWVDVGMDAGQVAIRAKCDRCRQGISLTGPSAHKTQVFFHCGRNERVPEAIGVEFLRVRASMGQQPERQRPQFAVLPEPEHAAEYEIGDPVK